MNTQGTRMTRWRFFSTVALIAVGLGMGNTLCAQTEKVSDGTGKEAPKPFSPQKGILLKVPFEKQLEPNFCGVAAIEMVAAYYGKQLNDSQYQYLKIDAEQNNGITGATMEVVLRASDFYTAIFKGTLDRKLTGIYRHLDLKRPLIVMVTSEDGKTSHYGVLTGYDSAKDQVVLSDPAGGEGEVFSLAQFEAAWKRANQFTLLAVPHGRESDSKP